MIKFSDDNKLIVKEEYRAILVGLEISQPIDESMEELEALAEADDIQVLGKMIQKLTKPNSATFVGKGKVEELREAVENMEANLVVFNDELSGMQLRNLEEGLNVTVIDRTILILDIFASRATSREGKLQVEMAQLKYRLPRLLGMGKSLSRQGGGIGTRGPGEKKLETDRRHIEKRLDDIRRELKDSEKVRKTQRGKREKNNIPIVALVGYTNSGKSSLMNKIIEITQSDTALVESKNMLFATLDTYARKIILDKGKEFILIDTVGFVSKLPHSIVEAFKSTLEDVLSADLLVKVMDGSSKDWQFQDQVTTKVLGEIGAGDIPIIKAFNKMDKLQVVEDNISDRIRISALTGQRVHVLLSAIDKATFGENKKVTLLVPYEKGNIVSYINERGKILSQEYLDEGTKIEAVLKPEDLGRLKDYVFI